MIGTFFKLVGKAMQMAINRPIQRFNIFSRVKKHLGEDAKYFMPAPRAIGSQSLRIGKPQQYGHLEGRSAFKSIEQRRQEAIANRNQRLLAGQTDTASAISNQDAKQKSFSEIVSDDNLVISASSMLPVIKTVTRIEPNVIRKQTKKSHASEEQAQTGGQLETQGQEKMRRPLPKLTSLQLSDPAVIWHVDNVPPGRLDLSKFQELMINKLADDAYWTPKQIAETYNIKEEYAENLIKYFKQIRIIISPKVKNALDYVARTNPAYQATKHIIYHVDKSLRSDDDKKYDETFLPSDKLDPEVRELLDAGALANRQDPYSRAGSIRRPEALKLSASSNKTEKMVVEVIETIKSDDVPKESSQNKSKRRIQRLAGPLNVTNEIDETKPNCVTSSDVKKKAQDAVAG